ncbi:TPA: Cro/Cl family transcriptional regulator [Vibrio vulnificus]|nr:helix-turn-helix domain-containing protein [Vibrio vulnificus]HAS6307030.1 Cro/Cl family transcriptional regulator [Vibrio vulnificus]HDY7578967.1 helix-turn-helix domain-containing protein [Vibrio vulnificus]
MDMFNTTQKPLRRAIDLVGGQLARAINSKQQNVWFWLNKSGRVPAEFVLPIEQATQGQVTRPQLRPDIYPECPNELKASNQ